MRKYECIKSKQKTLGQNSRILEFFLDFLELIMGACNNVTMLESSQYTLRTLAWNFLLLLDCQEVLEKGRIDYKVTESSRSIQKGVELSRIDIFFVSRLFQKVQDSSKRVQNGLECSRKFEIHIGRRRTAQNVPGSLRSIQKDVEPSRMFQRNRDPPRGGWYRL